MKLLIEIDLDNDAFSEPGELSRIIEHLADDLRDSANDSIEYFDYILRDIDGNKVGTCALDDSE